MSSFRTRRKPMPKAKISLFYRRWSSVAYALPRPWNYCEASAKVSIGDTLLRPQESAILSKFTIDFSTPQVGVPEPGRISWTLTKSADGVAPVPILGQPANEGLYIPVGQWSRGSATPLRGCVKHSRSSHCYTFIISRSPLFPEDRVLSP